jgi:hypothetical protein
MNHFILTRFNLRLWWKEDKRGGAILTEEWLEERFRLFEKFCLSSVMNQKCQSFKWICLFDEGTPEMFRRRVDGYRERCPQFYPFYLNEVETKHFQQFFQSKVYELADKGDERLLTTYLDNDDCLRDDYVEKTQELAEKVRFGTIITYKFGIQYYADMNLAVRIPYKNNHFLTYYEKLTSEPRTVWGFWHFSIFKYKGIRVMTVDNPKNPVWVEVIHKGNIDNDVKMTLSHKLITDRKYMGRFGADFCMMSPLRSWTVFCTKFLFRFMGQVVRRGGNKINRRFHG